MLSRSCAPAAAALLSRAPYRSPRGGGTHSVFACNEFILEKNGFAGLSSTERAFRRKFCRLGTLASDFEEMAIVSYAGKKAGEKLYVEIWCH